MSTQKASHILCDGKVVQVPVTLAVSTFTAADIPAVQSIFDEQNRPFLKNKTAVPTTTFSIKSRILPFSEILGKDELIVLIFIDVGPPENVGPKGKYAGLPENKLASEVTTDQQRKRQMIYGSALLCYFNTGVDFLPAPDFEALYNIVIDDYDIAVENNLTGGLRGAEGLTDRVKKERLDMVAGMYRGEKKAKADNPKEVWDWTADRNLQPLRPLYKSGGEEDKVQGLYQEVLKKLLIDNSGEGDKERSRTSYAFKNGELQAKGLRLYATCWTQIPQADAKACSVCREVFYCGKDCQKKDWKSHKPTCKPWTQLISKSTFS